jgi:hypothetical protein
MAKDKATRNLNPHKAARIAMLLWNERYAAQRGGSMEFWDSLTEAERQTCRKCLEQVLEAPGEGDRR